MENDMCKWGKYKKVDLCKPIKISKRDFAWVDSCLADIVQALNDANIETLGCCCGHGKDNGDIMLADGRQLIIKMEK